LIVEWIAAFFTASAVVLGILLDRANDDRDRWSKRAAAHLSQVQEARAAAVKSRFALAAARKEIAQARAKADEQRARVRTARAELDRAAGDPDKVVELWDSALGD